MNKHTLVADMITDWKWWGFGLMVEYFRYSGWHWGLLVSLNLGPFHPYLSWDEDA